jgi:hypothetical protein
MRTTVYVAIALVLVAFGYLALFSIGFPFALTGLLMLVLIRRRHRTDVLAPVFAWPWVFTLGYLLVAPIGCSSTTAATVAGGVAATGSTTCDALFLTYAGGPSYNPPLMPAALAGVVVATAVSLLFRSWLRRGSRRGGGVSRVAASRG